MMERTYEGFLKKIGMNSKENNKIAKQDIMDCFADLEDEGFDIICLLKNEDKPLHRNLIHISKPQSYASDIDELLSMCFKFSDIKETLLFAIPYLVETYKLKIKEYTFYHYLIDRGTTGQLTNTTYTDMDKILSEVEDYYLIEHIEIEF